MIYLIFIIFIFYTICCCLDGPDLKPKWKKWLGNKLHSLGDIYVQQPKYDLPNIDIPEIPLNIYKTHFEPIIIKSRIEIPEVELMYGSEEHIISIAKQSCINGLFKEIEKHENDLIKIEIDDNYYNSSKIITGEIKILQVKHYY